MNPGRTSGRGGQKDSTRRSTSAYLPEYGSASQQHSRSSQANAHASLRHVSSHYVSPYPPLEVEQPDIVSARSPAPHAQTMLSSSRRAYSSTSTATSRGHESVGGPETAQRQSLINALNEHRINNLEELRRVERLFAEMDSQDLTQPMTAAWLYYVNSGSLLREVRSLTRHYPFSSELLEEAKRRVYRDPASNRSWNYCWLVLTKIQADRLIPTFARVQATQPQMWGGAYPESAAVEQLTRAFIAEWNAALAQILRHWEEAPTRR